MEASELTARGDGQQLTSSGGRTWAGPQVVSKGGFRGILFAASTYAFRHFIFNDGDNGLIQKTPRSVLLGNHRMFSVKQVKLIRVLS